ncbi:hypothetical protein D3C73_865280 [compost metagenome]
MATVRAVCPFTVAVVIVPAFSTLPFTRTLKPVTAGGAAAGVAGVVGTEGGMSPPPLEGAIGVTVFDKAEVVLLPALLIAFTVKVYAVPLVSPVTVMGLAVP